MSPKVPIAGIDWGLSPGQPPELSFFASWPWSNPYDWGLAGQGLCHKKENGHDYDLRDHQNINTLFF